MTLTSAEQVQLEKTYKSAAHSETVPSNEKIFKNLQEQTIRFSNQFQIARPGDPVKSREIPGNPVSGISWDFVGFRGLSWVFPGPLGKDPIDLLMN